MFRAHYQKGTAMIFGSKAKRSDLTFINKTCLTPLLVMVKVLKSIVSEKSGMILILCNTRILMKRLISNAFKLFNWRMESTGFKNI